MVSFSEQFGVNDFIHFIIKTNNYCNIHCEHCNNLCDVPLRYDNENIWRREKWELPLSDLELFCKRFEGVGESDHHQLTGGETTFMPIYKVENYIDLLNHYGRKISLETNGYNLLSISKKYLNMIDLIILDNHGINEKLINECKLFLGRHFKGIVQNINVKYHYDLTIIREEERNKEKVCNLWMRDISMLDKVIYPCCVMPYLQVFDNNTKIKDLLIRNGWTIENPGVAEAMKNWEYTVPKYLIDQCYYHCFRPDFRSEKKVYITKKDIDIVRSPKSLYKEYFVEARTFVNNVRKVLKI